MKRSYSLDFFKLLFAYVIAFFHFGTPIAPGPTVTVQLFFFISGYFLARKFYTRSHADSGSTYSGWRYTLDHAKGLYPHYLFAYIAYLLYNTARALVDVLRAPTAEQIREILLSFYDQIPNLLFLQSAYTSHDSMNYPLWQLSALIIGGYFVYTLLCTNEKLSRTLLFPAAILMLLSLNESGVAFDSNYGPLYIPLLRAFCGLGYGVLIYSFTTTPLWTALRSRTALFNLSVILSVLCIFVFAEHGNIHFVTGALLILGCLEESTWLNKILDRKIFRHAGKLSLSIYVNHALICRFIHGFLSSRLTLTAPQQTLFYFTVLTAYSLFTLVLVEKLQTGYKKIHT